MGNTAIPVEPGRARITSVEQSARILSGGAASPDHVGEQPQRKAPGGSGGATEATGRVPRAASGRDSGLRAGSGLHYLRSRSGPAHAPGSRVNLAESGRVLTVGSAGLA